MSKLKWAGVFMAVAVLAGAVAFMNSQSRGAREGAPEAVGQKGKIFLGVTTPSAPGNVAELEAFEQAAGKKVEAVLFSQYWAHDHFDRQLLARLDARHKFPIVSWEPRDQALESACGGPHPEQPDYSLARINAGAFDRDIREWATGIRDWGKPVGIRFAPEMNGNWFPWSEAANGNEHGQYVEAWRHVWRVFDDVGARNVTWVWAPNIIYPGSLPLADLYPGDAYVDWVGIDGYNGGSGLPWGGWVSFDRLIQPTLNEVRGITQKPVVLTSIASSEAGGNKAAWISDFFTRLPEYPDIVGFVWVEGNREANWSIVSSEATRLAFRQGLSKAPIGASVLPSRRTRSTA